MLSYLAPPIVATFLLGVFTRRVNGRGAFIGLLFGLAIAVLTYTFKDLIFGRLHFLLIVPFLFLGSAAITYGASLCFAPPAEEQLRTTTFRPSDLRQELQRRSEERRVGKEC